MTQPVYLKQPKTKLVAYLLWFFLGTWGVHRFYLKQYKTAIAYVVVTGINFIATLSVLFSGMSEISRYCDPSAYSDSCVSMSPYSMLGYGIVSAISWIVWIAWIVDAFLIPKLVREQNAAIYATYPNQGQGNGYGMPPYATPAHMEYVQNQQPTYAPPVPQKYAPAPTMPQTYTQPKYAPPVVPNAAQEPTENLSLDKPNDSQPPQLPPLG